jgi:fatty-acyl-CoA synthase
VAVLKQGAQLDLEELREFASQSLAKYKLPSRLYFVDELPRNPAGKVQKFKIKESLAA